MLNWSIVLQIRHLCYTVTAMNNFGIDFTTSDFVLLGICGAIAIFLIANRFIGAPEKREN